ncbi:cyclase family protein [Coemansia spiralis]|nr:cyclase family protein [Coemansia spiralis]
MPEHGSQNQARRDSDTDSQSFASEEPWPSRIIRPGGTSIQAASSSSDGQYLWDTYDSVLSKMRYIDLTHTITPDIPIWRGFGNITFSQAVSKLTEQPFEYAKDKFVATAYKLTTDQMGTQLDAPAHFNPYYAASDEMPATFALRKLVVIDMSAQVLKNSSYALSVADVLDWEKQHGRIPAMSVVFVRSDWSKAWPYVNTDVFPQVSLEAVQFLHLKRNILFHGHEPLDADMTPNFDAEAWALRNGYAQAEGVTNLHLVPPTGCLLSTGFPKFAGGVGNYVRYVAVCPSEWKHGVVPGATPEAPLPKFVNPLVWNEEKGRRVRALSQKAIV